VVTTSPNKRQFLERGGTVLGIQEAVEYEEAKVALTPGDIVILYTDGISEAANGTGEQFGEQRLCEFVQRLPKNLGARVVGERVLAALREYLGPVEAQDDITLLVLRVLEPAEMADVTSPPVEAVTVQ
jgi:phosphoserine phosphatase RsbU/P